MPGNTNNPTILAAINQAIEAINSIQSELSGIYWRIDFSSEVAKLEEIRVVLETQSAASIVAQNTNFNDLISAVNSQTAAIADLVLTCQTIVETTNVTNNIRCGGDGSSGPGIYPPDPTGIPGENPPIGYNPPSAIVNRRCKMAYAFHENIKEWVQLLADKEADQIAGDLIQGGIATLMAYLGTIVGELSTPIPLIDATIGAVVGWLLGMAIKLTVGDFNLSSMGTILNNPANETDFVCAAYSAPSGSGIVSAYLQVASDKGMSLADLALLGTIVTIDLANYVKFSREQYIEDALANYNPNFDCDDCPQPDYLLVTSEESPYNTLVIGDSFSPAGEPEGWYVDTSGNWTFTTQVATTSVRLSFEYQNSAPAGFGTGELDLTSYGQVLLFSDGDGEWEVFDETRPCVLDNATQYSLIYIGQGVHGVRLRNIKIESVV